MLELPQLQRFRRRPLFRGLDRQQRSADHADLRTRHHEKRRSPKPIVNLVRIS